jgi:hypothetical protein
MVTRRTVLAGMGLGLTGVGGAFAYEQLAPERATRVEAGGGGSGPSLSAAAETLASGQFSGKAGHRCSGRVDLVRDGEDHFLRFVNYEQTQGPDVFVYVCPAPDPDTAGEIAAGTRVLIDGGADGGESTKTGTFVQRLPDGVAVEAIRGVGIWCENFRTPFGAATLE